MKRAGAFLATFLWHALSFAQDKAHSHGSGGETEHLYPVLVVLGVLVVGGAVFHFMSKKK